MSPRAVTTGEARGQPRVITHGLQPRRRSRRGTPARTDQHCCLFAESRPLPSQRPFREPPSIPPLQKGRPLGCRALDIRETVGNTHLATTPPHTHPPHTPYTFYTTLTSHTLYTTHISHTHTYTHTLTNYTHTHTHIYSLYAIHRSQMHIYTHTLTCYTHHTHST